MVSSLFVFQRFANFLIVSSVITPFVLSFWRGTWYVLDLFVFPQDVVLSGWITLSTSFGTIFSVSLVENYLKACLDRQRRKQQLYLLLFYPLAVLSVASWRGLWLLIDYYTTISFISGIVKHAVGFTIVLAAKAPSSIVAVPGYCNSEINGDTSKSILQMRYAVSVNMSPFVTWLFNAFITVFVIGSGVICYWRGTWTIVSVALEPKLSVKSSLITIIVGTAGCGICYCLSEVLAIKKLDPPFNIGYRILEVVFVYILGLGSVCTWIGFWSLIDICILPDKPVASALLCHLVGIVCLYLLRGFFNLIASPVGCRSLNNEMLDGLDMGSYLKRQGDREVTPEPNEKAEDKNCTKQENVICS